MTSNHKIRYEYDAEGKMRPKFIQTLENLDEFPQIPNRGDGIDTIDFVPLKKYLRTRVNRINYSKLNSLKPSYLLGRNFKPSLERKDTYKTTSTLPKDEIIHPSTTSNEIKFTPALAIPTIGESFLMNPLLKPEKDEIPKAEEPATTGKGLFVEDSDVSSDELTEQSLEVKAPNTVYTLLHSEDDDDDITPITKEKFSRIDITSPVKPQGQPNRRPSHTLMDPFEPTGKFNSPSKHISSHNSEPNFNKNTHSPSLSPSIKGTTPSQNQSPKRFLSLVNRPILAQPSKPLSKPEPDAETRKKVPPPAELEEAPEEDVSSGNNSEDEDYTSDDSDSTSESDEEYDEASKTPASYSAEADDFVASDNEESMYGSSHSDYVEKPHGSKKRLRGSASKKLKRKRKIRISDSEEEDDSLSDIFYSAVEDQDEDKYNHLKRGVVRRKKPHKRKLSHQISDDEEEDEFVVDDSVILYSTDDELDKLLDDVEELRRDHKENTSSELKSKRRNLFTRKQKLRGEDKKKSKIMRKIKDKLKNKKAKENKMKGKAEEKARENAKNNEDSEPSGKQRSSSPTSRKGLKIIRQPPKRRKISKSKDEAKAEILSKPSENDSSVLIYPNRPETQELKHVDLSQDDENSNASTETDSEFQRLFKQKVGEASKSIPGISRFSESDENSEESNPGSRFPQRSSENVGKADDNVLSSSKVVSNGPASSNPNPLSNGASTNTSVGKNQTEPEKPKTSIHIGSMNEPSEVLGSSIKPPESLEKSLGTSRVPDATAASPALSSDVNSSDETVEEEHTEIFSHTLRLPEGSKDQQTQENPTVVNNNTIPREPKALRTSSPAHLLREILPNTPRASRDTSPPTLPGKTLPTGPKAQRDPSTSHSGRNSFNNGPKTVYRFSQNSFPNQSSQVQQRVPFGASQPSRTSTNNHANNNIHQRKFQNGYERATPISTKINPIQQRPIADNSVANTPVPVIDQNIKQTDSSRKEVVDLSDDSSDSDDMVLIDEETFKRATRSVSS